MIAWLSLNFPENASKAEFYELIKLHKTNVPFKCVQIARKYDHKLFFTLSLTKIDNVKSK